MHHRLKIEDGYYEAIRSGDKTFEIRYNDRGYQKGDCITFTSVDGLFQHEGLYLITYVTGYNQKDNVVVFGIKEISPTTESAKDE